MANRVCLGARSATEFGLFISKPGFDVLTAGLNDMLFHSNQQSAQIVQTGTLAISNGGSADITIPNLGYNPLVIAFPQMTGTPGNASNITIVSKFEYLSLTSIRLYRNTTNVSANGNVTYIILGVRGDG